MNNPMNTIETKANRESLLLDKVILEDLPITNFPDKDSFFENFVHLARQRRQKSSTPAVSLTYNVFSANLAQKNNLFKQFLLQADILRCDGVGALLGSKIVGNPIHARLTNADYFPEMLEYLAANNLTVFLLGGKPGIAEKALNKLETITQTHSVIGVHHGYLKGNEPLNQSVIEQINQLQPDVIIVGMGMPLQEHWIFDNKNKIDTGIFFAVGAMIDYYGGAQYRCLPIYRKLGLEWFTRLVRYPKRMFGRYVIGNPYYLARIFKLSLQQKVALIKQALQPQART